MLGIIFSFLGNKLETFLSIAKIIGDNVMVPPYYVGDFILVSKRGGPPLESPQQSSNKLDWRQKWMSAATNYLQYQL